MNWKTREKNNLLRSILYTVALISTWSCTKTKPSVEPVTNQQKPSLPSTPDPTTLATPNTPAASEGTTPAPAATQTNSQSTVSNTPATPTNASPQPPSTAAPIAATPPTPVEAPKPNYPVLDDCDVNVKFTEGEPVFLPENKVVITRVMSPCFTKEGVVGHRKNAGWMAMGFPCTGGEGRIDWKGTNYNRPKMVTFLLETSCAMAPMDTSKIKLEATKALNLSTNAPMIAFNPFVIQYWEIPGFEDADTTFTVDIRSGKGLDDAWIRFIKPKPLKILLVGRENAWVPGNFMYAVEGDLIWSSKNRFTFKVDTARMLKGEEVNSIKSRCEALKPERDCSRVF